MHDSCIRRFSTALSYIYEVNEILSFPSSAAQKHVCKRESSTHGLSGALPGNHYNIKNAEKIRDNIILYCKVMFSLEGGA